jgi:hypothetical protein
MADGNAFMPGKIMMARPQTILESGSNVIKLFLQFTI